MKKPLFYIILFHVIVIICSNYLVQLPLIFFGLTTTWGALTFPFIFLATDLTSRILGAGLARSVIFKVMFPALFISYFISVLFQQGTYQGLNSILDFNVFVIRISLASFLAYSIGQFLDIQIFNRLRKFRSWWIAPVFSSILSSLIDTFIFYFIAFWKTSDEFLASHWIEIAWIDYFIKLFIMMIFFIPLYGILLNYIVLKIKS